MIAVGQDQKKVLIETELDASDVEIWSFAKDYPNMKVTEKDQSHQIQQ